MIASRFGRIVRVSGVLIFMANALFLGTAQSFGGLRQRTSDDPLYPQGRHPEIGFANRSRLYEHFEKHGGEFPGLTREEYLRRAQDLRDRRTGDGILEFVREDRVITRFDRKSGAFLAFDQNLTIRTFFKPNDGEAYFKRQQRRVPREP